MELHEGLLVKLGDLQLAVIDDVLLHERQEAHLERGQTRVFLDELGEVAVHGIGVEPHNLANGEVQPVGFVGKLNKQVIDIEIGVFEYNLFRELAEFISTDGLSRADLP